VCLEWDFGFCCAFCLLHETDFLIVPDARMPPLEVEHFVPVSVDGDLVNEYSNCILACRLCNGSRRGRAVALDPTRVAWGHRFQWRGLHLEPIDPDDHGAAEALAAYELNYPTKVTRREFRQRIVNQYLEARVLARALHAQLLDEQDPDRRAKLKSEINRQELTLRDRKVHALRYRLVPPREMPSCACRLNEPVVPDWLASQALAVPSGPPPLPPAGPR